MCDYKMITAVDPFFTASCAYSTWNRCPSGENTVIARSYLDDMANTGISKLMVDRNYLFTKQN